MSVKHVIASAVGLVAGLIIAALLMVPVDRW